MNGGLFLDLSRQLVCILSLISIKSIIGILVVGKGSIFLLNQVFWAILSPLLMCFEVLDTHFRPNSLLSHVIQTFLSFKLLPPFLFWMQVMVDPPALLLFLHLLKVHTVHVYFGCFLFAKLFDVLFAHFILFVLLNWFLNLILLHSDLWSLKFLEFFNLIHLFFDKLLCILVHLLPSCWISKLYCQVLIMLFLGYLVPERRLPSQVLFCFRHANAMDGFWEDIKVFIARIVHFEGQIITFVHGKRERWGGSFIFNSEWTVHRFACCLEPLRKSRKWAKSLKRWNSVSSLQLRYCVSNVIDAALPTLNSSLIYHLLRRSWCRWQMKWQLCFWLSLLP